MMASIYPSLPIEGAPGSPYASLLRSMGAMPFSLWVKCIGNECNHVGKLLCENGCIASGPRGYAGIADLRHCFGRHVQHFR